MYVSFFSWFIAQFAEQIGLEISIPANQAGGDKRPHVKVTEKMSGLLRLMSGYFENVAK
jgi:hypothetical protein